MSPTFIFAIASVLTIAAITVVVVVANDIGDDVPVVIEGWLAICYKDNERLLTLVFYGAGCIQVSAFIISIGGDAVIDAAGQGDVGEVGVVRIAGYTIIVASQGDWAGSKGICVDIEAAI